MIILVRHGQAAQGVEDLDPALTEIGQEQARLAGEALRGRGVVRLAASPLRRTQETAAPIASTLTLPIETRIEVAEVFDPSWPAEQRKSMIGPFMMSRWSEQSEHLRAWRQRAVDALVAWGKAADDAGGDIVVVSHYIAICAAIGSAIEDDRVVPAEISNCSLTLLDVKGAGLALIEAGSVAHLPAELVTGARHATSGR